MVSFDIVKNHEKGRRYSFRLQGIVRVGNQKRIDLFYHLVEMISDLVVGKSQSVDSQIFQILVPSLVVLFGFLGLVGFPIHLDT